MAVTKTFTFTGSLESWVGTDDGKAYAVNTSIDIGFDAIGRNQVGEPTWTWTGTWEDLGFLTGQAISKVQINFDGEVDQYNLVDISSLVLELDSESTTYTAYTWNITGTESYNTKTGTLITFTTPRPSTETITLRFVGSLDTANNASAALSMNMDNVYLEGYYNTNIDSIATITTSTIKEPSVSTSNSISSVLSENNSDSLSPIIDAKYNGYEIERKIGTGEWIFLTRVTDITFAHLDEDLTPGETYTYRIKRIVGTKESA